MVSQISKTSPQLPAPQQQQNQGAAQARKVSPTAKPPNKETDPSAQAKPESNTQRRQASRLKADPLEVARRNRVKREKDAEAAKDANTRTQVKEAYKLKIKSARLEDMNSINDGNQRQEAKAAAAAAAVFDEAVAEAEAQIDAARKVAAATENLKVENREAGVALQQEREKESSYQNEVAMGRLADRRDLVHILRAAVEEGSAETAKARTLARANRDLQKMEEAVVRQEEETVKTILDKLEIAEEQLRKSNRVITGTRPHQTTQGAFEENSDTLGSQDKTLGLVPLAFSNRPTQEATGAFSDRNEPVIEPANLNLSDDKSVEAIQASIQEAKTRVAGFQEEAEAAAAHALKKIEKASETLKEKRTSPAIGNAEEARRLAEEVARQTATEPEKMIATQRFITTQSALQVLN